MADTFLEETGVRTEEAAIRNAINAAVQQRKNYVYASDADAERTAFKAEWARLLREESKHYKQQCVSDIRHCDAIATIADALSTKFESVLHRGRLRYGTSAKAFNLYLKFLWHLNLIQEPPHCPVDGIVMAAAGINGAWTSSDSRLEYLEWIEKLKRVAGPVSLTRWEDEVWLREMERQRSRQQHARAACA